MIVISVIGGALTAFGTLSLALSFLVYPIARVVLGFNYFLKISAGLGKVVKLLAQTFLWFGRMAQQAIMLVFRAMLANPILAVITLIISGLIMLWQNWDTVKENLINIWNTLKKNASEIWESIKNTINEKWNNLVNTAKNFGSNMMTNFKDGIIETFEEVKKSIQEKIDWIKEKLGFSAETEQKIEQTKRDVMNAGANAMTNSTAGNYFMQGFGTEIPNKPKWSGGYAGNGGKYEPKGIYHGGEYIMTKEATSRLGVATLNALNYGKQALVAGGLGLSVGLAQATPIQLDSRPPLKAQTQTQTPSQPMAVNITINATANQDPKAIAQEVARQIALLQSKEQAKLRSRMTDKS